MFSVCSFNSSNFLYIKDGKTYHPTINNIKKLFNDYPTIICNKQQLQQVLKSSINCLDVLELYAFVHPTKFTSPSISGLAKSLELEIPKNLEDSAKTLIIITSTLLSNLQNLSEEKKNTRLAILPILAKHNWNWYDNVANILKANQASKVDYKTLKTWEKSLEKPIKKVQHVEYQPINPPKKENVEKKLAKILGSRNIRDNQLTYSTALIPAFNSKEDGKPPNLVFAEAGTGTGKTLGYIAPTLDFVENNLQNVWISTYTKALQRQIDSEFYKIYPKNKKEQVVVIKGRENYICLLKFDNLINSIQTTFPEDNISIITVLISLWVSETEYGDIIGGDFHSWLEEQFHTNVAYSLADRRGECIHSSCPHYKKCFIEKNLSKAQTAKIVIANHSFLLNRYTKILGEGQDNFFVFDEAHHLMHVADSVFSAHLTGLSGIELLHWLVGRNKNHKEYVPYMSGLSSRIRKLLNSEEEQILNDILVIAQKTLPLDGWLNRINNNFANSIFERFLSEIYQHITLANSEEEDFYSVELNIKDIPEHIIATSIDLRKELRNLEKALEKLILTVYDRILKDTNLDSQERAQLEVNLSQIKNRAIYELSEWRKLLDGLTGEIDSGFIAWFEITKIEGRTINVGLHQHYLDVSEPFAKNFLDSIDGAVITSATLSDAIEDNDDFKNKINKTFGLPHIQAKANEVFSIGSPFNYKEQAAVIILNDAKEHSTEKIFERLFLASNGGALGLFTSIRNLRSTYQKLEKKMADNNIHLLSQHVSNSDISTLIDIFRDEKDSCLLGTDAVRDGIDIPGDSLRLVIFDKTPWERQTILNKARKDAFGEEYINSKVRAKLRQAFGRLIRTATDRGIFVMVNNSFPSRFYTAFPKDVQIMKMGLENAEEFIADFLKKK